jgi:PTS system nitrogen regulatory IIA component
MTNSQSGAAQQERGSPTSPLILRTFLDQEKVVIDLCVASRKKLFQELAKLIGKNLNQGSEPQNPEELSLSEEEVFETLHDRERLGCTALGKGIALPHGRLAGIQQPVVAIAKLDQAIDYDAPDGKRVWLAVCLLVPIDANEIHLQLLASLASRFSDEKFVEDVRLTTTQTDLYQLFADI